MKCVMFKLIKREHFALNMSSRKTKNETKNDKNDVHDNNGSGEMKQLNTSNKKLIKEKQFGLKQKENAID